MAFQHGSITAAIKSRGTVPGVLGEISTVAGRKIPDDFKPNLAVRARVVFAFSLA